MTLFLTFVSSKIFIFTDLECLLSLTLKINVRWNNKMQWNNKINWNCVEKNYEP